MFRFDKTGKYVGEIGQASYAMLFAEKVKVDPQDNIWVVDQMANTVMEFDSDGRLVMLLGRKAESENVPVRGAAPPAAPGGGGAGGGGAQGGGAGAGAAAAGGAGAGAAAGGAAPAAGAAAQGGGGGGRGGGGGARGGGGGGGGTPTYDWLVHFEGDGKDAKGTAVHYVADGKIDNIGLSNRTLSGTWVSGAVKGTFKLQRQ